MILINQAAREMTAKVVYYGPGLCGKTTNLIKLHETLPADKKGKMLSLATKQDRTLFFDLLPVEVGSIKGMKVRIQLYTVPGQVFYDETRRLVLKGADAVVFVVDSQAPMVDANRESFENLITNLEENGLDFDSLPIVVQYNKRDIDGVLPVEELEEKLNFGAYPSQEAVAVEGDGVKATFNLVVQILLQKLAGRPMKAPPKKKLPEKEAVPEAAETPKEEVAKEAVPGQDEPIELGGPAGEPMEIELPTPQDDLEDTSPGSEDSPIHVTEQHDYDRVEEVDLSALIEERKRSTRIVTSDKEEILDLSAEQIVEGVEEEEVEPVGTPAPALDDTAISMMTASGEGDLETKLEALETSVKDLQSQLTEILGLLKQR